MVYCTLEEAWGNDFCTDNSCSSYIINNVGPINENNNIEQNESYGIKAIESISNDLYIHPQIQPPQIQPPQIQPPQIQPQQIQPPQIQPPQIQPPQIQPPQIQSPQIQPPQIQPPQQIINQSELNNNSSKLHDIINQLRYENNELKKKLKNKFNFNIDNLPELFLYGILIFLVIDLLVGFKRK
jgi:hypothetical protein